MKKINCCTVKVWFGVILAIALITSNSTSASVPIGAGGVGAPFQTKLADTLPAGRMLLFTKHESLNYHNNATLDPKYDIFSDTHFKAAMGVNDDVMLTLSTSAAYRNGTINRKDETLRGLGETRGLLQWRVKKGDIKAEDPISTISVALLLGIKTPTGDNHIRLNNGTQYPMPMQLGSGSVDYSFGMAATGDYDYFEASLSGLYTVNGDHGGYKFGNRFELSGRGSFNLFDQPEGILSSLNLIGELTNFYRERDIKDSALLNYTGGNWFYVSTGINTVFIDKFSLAFLFQLPLYRHKNQSGRQQNEAFRWMLMGGFLL